MNNSKDAKLLKVVAAGPSGAGKTSLLKRITDDSFSQQYICTIGVDFATKMLITNNQIIKLQIWDTAGQERFASISRSYYRGASGIFLTFDLSNADSFQDMQHHYDEVIKQTKELKNDIPILLVGCKCDLTEKRAISFDVAQAFARSLNISYIETSAKNSINCLEAADKIARLGLAFQELHNKDEQNPQLDAQKQENQQEIKKNTCC